MWFWTSLPFPPKSGQHSFVALDLTACRGRVVAQRCVLSDRRSKRPTSDRHSIRLYSRVHIKGCQGQFLSVSYSGSTKCSQRVTCALTWQATWGRTVPLQHEGCGFESGPQSLHVDFSLACVLLTVCLLNSIYTVVMSVITVTEQSCNKQGLNLYFIQ